MRGPNIIPGYYCNEEKSKETFTSDGWLMSGDVGIILYPNNALKLIDRKNNIFKLQQGEYIAPEKLENAYKLAVASIGEVYIYGDGLKTFIVAIVSMAKKSITKFATENNIPGAEDPETVKDTKEFTQALLKPITSTAKANKFNSLEIPKDIYVSSTSFSDLNLLTTAFKLKRHEASKFFAPQLEMMYKRTQV